MAYTDIAPSSTDSATPEEWLKRLWGRLQGQASQIEIYESYYEGSQGIPLNVTSSKYRNEFARMLKGISDNWLALVVDAVEERLHVTGFRFGTIDGDQDAWAIWQNNCLDADSELAHQQALITSRACVLVWPGADGEPEITVEHPLQTCVAYEPGSRRTRAAALKVWADEWTRKTFANVYLPEAIYKFEAPSTGLGEGGPITVGAPTWATRGPAVVNPMGVVPMVELLNRPRIGTTGRSEIQDLLSLQDQINKLACDMLVASEFAAFAQRWATGMEPERDENDQPIAPFKAGADRLWMSSSKDTQFGQFAASDLGNYVKAIENRVQSLASRSRTPPHYLLGSSGSFPSGESLKATETGLVAKVRSRQRHFEERWEEVMRLAFAVKGDKRSKTMDAQTIWKDPESRTESEHVDALVKKLSLGVPKEQLWEDAGYSPQQIARFKEMLQDELQQLGDEGVTPKVTLATQKVGAEPPVPSAAPGVPAPATGAPPATGATTK